MLSTIALGLKRDAVAATTVIEHDVVPHIALDVDGAWQQAVAARAGAKAALLARELVTEFELSEVSEEREDQAQTSTYELSRGTGFPRR